MSGAICKLRKFGRDRQRQTEIVSNSNRSSAACDSLTLRRGFTLIEFLVVVTVITVLISLLLPAVQRAREAARSMQCRNNLRQLAVAMHNYHAASRQFPMAAVWNVDAVAGTLNYGQSWGQSLLPFVDQSAIANSFDLSQPIWSGDVNRALIARHLPIFNCPSNPKGLTRNTTTWSTETASAGGGLNCLVAPAAPVTATWGNSDYIVTTDVRSPLYSNLRSVGVTLADRHCMFYSGDANAGAVVSGNGVSTTGIDGSPNMKKVSDGLANTIMIGELAARNQLWEKRRIVASPRTNDSAAAAVNFSRLLNQQTHFAGGGWADPMNNQWVNGGNRDGNNEIRISNADRNSCVINCTNLIFRAFYSFHEGTSTFAMGDGSVVTISEYVDDYAIAFLLTRAGGEVVGEY